MKKFYLFLLTAAVMLLNSATATAAEGDRVRVDLSVDNMDWVYWNSTADKRLAWGRQAKTIDGYDIYLSAVSYEAAPNNSQSPNNMAFWDREHLQLYALWGSRHPLNYELNCISGNYKIVEIGMDFVVGTHPTFTPSIAEYGVSVSIAGEEAVECFSKTEPVHVEATDLDGTTAVIAVDYVANEALNGKNNGLFANTTSFYVVLEELDDWTKANNALNKTLDEYRAYEDALRDMQGDEPGMYSPEAYNAFSQAILFADELFDPGKDDPTAEEIAAARQNIIDTYNALIATKIGLTLEDGYYRIHSSQMFTNKVPTGEKDENGVDITEDVSMYKYLRSYEDNNTWYNIWATRDENNPTGEAMNLYKLTNKEGGLYDLYNMGSETRLNSVVLSANVTSTADSDKLIWLEPAKTEAGETSVYICMADQKSKPVAPNGMLALHQKGHASGAGVNGYVIGWWAADGSGPVLPTMWVFEPVSDEEAQAAMDAWLPVKEHNQLVKDYNAMKTDAQNKLLTAKDYLVGDGLITSTDQLSSPWTEPSEGSIEALIDGNSTTFWHSKWSDGNVAAHTHYLQVALPEAGYDLMQMQITRRNVANDHVILWGVMGSNDPEAADEAWTDLGQIATPYGSKTETIKSDLFQVQGFQYLRFYIDDTTTKENGVTRGYGHMSEFQLFAVTENPNSQYAQLGVIATNLEDVLEKQKDIEAADLTQANYDELKAAYDAFMAEVVDPTELRELIAQWDGKENMVVGGTNPGFWTNTAAGDAFKQAVADAKAYNEAGIYTRTQTEKFVEDIKAKSAKLLEGAIGIQTGKWYKFRFATEAEYEKYGWDKTPAKASVNAFEDVIDEALFGKYVTPANVETESVERTSTNDEGEETTSTFTLKTVVPVDESEVALGFGIYVDAADEIAMDDLAQFRFIAVGDSAYIIQNKASGLFIRTTGGTNYASLSVHPSLFNVSAIGYGQNVIAAKTFDGVNHNYLHIARSYNALVTWNANTPGSNSGLFIEEVGDVEANYDGTTFNMPVVHGALNALCYPVEISAEDGMYGISSIEGTEITLAPITKAEGGRPFLYVDGNLEDYVADQESELVQLKHGYDLTTEADTTSCLIGTFQSKTLKTGDVVVEGNTFVVLKDVMQGGVVAANSAYMTAEGTGFKRSDRPTVTIDMDASDGIGETLAKVAKVGELYTIDGQLVAKKANLNTLQNMPKGVYILNGVKVAVK